MKEYHIGIVTRNIEKASGTTSFEKTSKVSSQALQGAVYFIADTLYDGEYPIPAYPPFGYASLNGAGDFWVPKVGDHLLIELDESLDLPDPRFICCLYTNIRDIHRDFKKHYPYRLGRVTNCGHKLIWDDTEKEETVNFEHTFGQRLFFDKDGSILLHGRDVTVRNDKDEVKDEFELDWFKQFYDRTNKKFQMRYQEVDAKYFQLLWDRTAKLTSLKQDLEGQFAELKFDGATNKITLHDHHANKLEMDGTGIKVTDKNNNIVVMDSSGIKTTDKNGNIVEMKGGAVNVTSVGTCDVKSSGKTKITASEIELNGSASGITTMNSHQGVVDLITGVPVQPSTTVKSDI